MQEEMELAKRSKSRPDIVPVRGPTVNIHRAAPQP